MKRPTLSLALALVATGAAAGEVNDFTSDNLRPPVWLKGEYHTANVGLFDQYLYVIPQVYIYTESDFAPTNGSIVQMYAQFDGNSIERTYANREEAEAAEMPALESWSCSMFYYDDLADKGQDDLLSVLFYLGTGELGSMSGTYSGVNSAEQAEFSAWRNDPDLSTVTLSSENAVGEQYYIYQCAMFRKLEDEFSDITLKVNDRVAWQYGYKLYASKGDYEVDIADTGRGELIVLDHAASLTATVLVALSAFVF